MSIYNSKLNCVFIHVPRCAGSSIESIMGGTGHKDIVYFKRFLIGQSDLEWKGLFKFAFVRNPYTKFVSSYKWAVENFEELENVDINDWIGELKEKYKSWRDDSLEALMFKEQWRFVCNQYYHPLVDFVGKIENIVDDWGYISNKLKIDKKLPHLNKSDPKELILTSKTRELVKEIYAKDFETFGYET